MTDALVLRTHPAARGRIVRWMLEEVGHPYRTEPLPDAAGAPAVRHGGVVIAGSPAICAYLADAFPAAALAPARTDPLREAYRRWLFFSARPEDGVPGADAPAGWARMAGYGTFAAMLDGLEATVATEGHLVGGRFTAADLYVGAQLGFGLRSGLIEARPAFDAYWARLSGRPAHRRAVELEGEPAFPPPG